MHMRIGTELPFHACRDSTTRARLSDNSNLFYAWGKSMNIITEMASYEKGRFSQVIRSAEAGDITYVVL